MQNDFDVRGRQQRQLAGQVEKLQALLDAGKADRVAVARQLEDTRTGLRLCKQREAKMKETMAKVNGSQKRSAVATPTIEQLSAQLGELQGLHRESKARQKTAYAELLELREKDRIALTEARQKLEERGLVGSDRCNGPDQLLVEEQDRTRALETQVAQLQSELLLSKTHLDQATCQLGNSEINAPPSVPAAQYDSLNCAAGELVRKHRAATDEAAMLTQCVHRLASSNLRLSTLRSGVAWELQVTRERLRAESGDRCNWKTIAHESEETIDLLLDAMHALETELDTEQSSRRVVVPQLPRCDVEVANAFDDSIFLRADLALANERLEQAHAQLANANDAHVALLRSHKDVSRRFEGMEAQTSRLQAALKQSEEHEVHAAAQIKAANDSLLAATTAKDELTEELKKCRIELRAHKEQQRLSDREVEASRVRIAALQEENAALSQALEHAMPFEESYNNLLSSTKAVLSQLDITESQLQCLFEENTLLTSHSNTQHKIKYQNTVRQDLTEAKLKVGELESNLRNEQLRSERLERELKALRTVDLAGNKMLGGSGGRVTRVKVGS
ncbi:unnamed protein product [Parajaminaea phylloscopi]